MKKSDAKRIAESVTSEQLAAMFERAKTGITDWEAASTVNKAMTRGTAWNILWGAFKASPNPRPMAKVNMIWEFGDFLDASLLPEKPARRALPVPHHQEPNFA
jgi:hypothetical protein